MKPRPTLVFAIHPVQHQHVQVHVEIERRAKALNECDDAAPGAGFAREACTVDQVGFDGTDHNGQYPAKQGGPAVEQQAQWPGKTQHPLASGHLRNDVVH